jgi:hypothetical protein
VIGTHHANVPFIIKRAAVEFIRRRVRREQGEVDFPLLKLSNQAVWLYRDDAHADRRGLYFKGGDKRHDHRAQGVIRGGKGERSVGGDRVKGDGLQQHVDIRQDTLDGAASASARVVGTMPCGARINSGSSK